ncbi:MAG: hypothetical protein B5M56_06030 [Desulfococcus sp. 4484_241]|nr:MAG: hypothetical protein B5M56_06030 [Desulfococcus sp. 4484_241]RLC31082.1 MAG: hypothetical protein DRH32_04795 [Deltaproteobacteria bacterium]
MIPSFYSFVHKSKVFYGTLSLEQIPGELSRIPATRPLVITDKKTEPGIIRALAGAFARMPDSLTVFDNVSLLVDEEGIKEIAEVYRESGCNSILALGGSRVIDMARGAAAAVTLGGDSLVSLAGKDKVEGPLPPLYAIPTMVQTRSALGMDLVLSSGSGSYRIVSPLLMPRGVFIDKRAMTFASGREVARGALASLFRAVEAATGPEGNPVSVAFSATSVRMLSENLPKAVTVNSKKVQAGATCACVFSEIAVSNTTSGVGLAVADAVHKVCGVPRDLAGAVILPGLLRLRAETAKDAMERLLLAAAGADEFSSTSSSGRVTAAVKVLCDMADNIARSGNMTLSLTSMGLPSGYEEIAKQVVDNAEALGNETVSYEQVLDILKSAA